MVEDVATQIALTEREHGINTSVEEYLKELKFGLVEVVYEWARGMVIMHGIIILLKHYTTSEEIFHFAGICGDHKAY